MYLITMQLQREPKILIDSLKRGEKVEITDEGQLLGIAYPVCPKSQEMAMARFFGIHSNYPADSVEAELRVIRQGRAKSDEAK